MCLEFKTKLAQQHYEEVSEWVSRILDDWDTKLLARIGNDLIAEDIAQLTTNLIQIRCQQFRQCAFEAAQLDLQAEANEMAVSAELSPIMGVSGSS